MARLPDTYGKRPSLGFGRPNQLAPVVPDPGIGQGLTALGAGILDFDASMKRIQNKTERSDAKDRNTKLQEWILKE